MAPKSKNIRTPDESKPLALGSGNQGFVSGFKDRSRPDFTAAPDAPITRLGFVGDLMLGRGVDAVAGTKPTEAFWGDVGPMLWDADSVIGNLESAITDTKERWKRCRKSFRFQARPKVIDILKAGNIGGVCLANNHILDCEVTGLTDTLHHLDRAGIARAGAGKNIREAIHPALFRAGGVAVGMVALTNTMPEFAAGPETAGTHYVKIKDDRPTLDSLRRLQSDLRRDGADVTVLTGPNLRPWPPARYRRFARAVIDLGFDVVHGHSAHILQGVEFRGKGLILYDTGDCLDDYWVFPGIRTDRSAIFFVEFGPGGVQRLNIVPTIITPARVGRAQGREARAIIRNILRMSPSLAASGPDLTAALDFSLEDSAEKEIGARGNGDFAPQVAGQTMKSGGIQ
jgi:poly-gamma-glutamate synthesis protein (capsule biosynthesis protein)